MIAGIRVGGWSQGLYDISSTKKHRYGTLRITDDGRKFRYAKAGEALVAGQIAQGTEVEAHHFAETGEAVAKGAKQISLVVGATAVSSNLFDDGFFQVYDGAAGTVGLQYKINSHTPCGSAGTTVVNLDDPIKIALISTDTWSLIPAHWGGTGVTHNGNVAKGPAGVPLIAVTSAYYCWLQTGGPACVYAENTVALGSPIVTAVTEGSYITMTVFDSAVLGFTYSIASVATKYCPVFLTID
jgi:hypothetical protein